jgi:putative tricarboxylic transport membrane protein
MAEPPVKGRGGSDLAVGVVVLVFCAVAYAVTLSFDTAPAALAQNVQPATFPRLVIMVIAVLALTMMLLGRGREAAAKKPLPLAVWVSALVLLAFVLTFQYLGPVAAMMALCLGLPLYWGERRWRLILPFALLFPLLVHLLFVEVLEVHFEPSPLVFW